MPDYVSQKELAIERLNRKKLETAQSASTAAHIANKINPHEVTKAQVGLGNVPDVAPSQIIFGSNGGTAITAGQTKYIGLFTADSAYYSAFVFPVAGTISNLKAFSNGAPGVNQSYTLTLMKNNAAQTVTCTIPYNNNTAEDTTHLFTVAAGDRVSLKWVNSAGAASAAAAHFGFMFIPN
jgi:hypothetical protein